MSRSQYQNEPKPVVGSSAQQQEGDAHHEQAEGDGRTCPDGPTMRPETMARP